MDKRLYNICLLGLSFTFLFAAYQSMGNIEKTLLRSVQHDYPSFTGDGYTSLSISYFVFGFANWVSPSVVNFTGCKIAMIIGAICYTMFLVSFLWLSSFLLYLMSAVQGFGAAILWTAQGTYLTLNSDSSTMSRNTGVFWMISNMSMLLGNAFVSYALRDKDDFDKSTRTFIYTVLIAVSVFGTLLFLLLRSPVSSEGTVNERVETISFIQQIKDTKSLFLTKDMRLLNISFFFTGLHMSFYASVYSSSIGFTKRMGSNSKQLVAVSGLFIGIGEILGGLIFSILGQKTFENNIISKGLSHSAVIALGFIVNIVAYGLIFINLPNDSPFGDTTAKSFINPNQYLAILCSFLLGFGDSCFNTQLYNIVGLKYSENSAPPMALFNFMQSIAAALSFYYSNYFGIQIQLILLMVSLTMATLTFFKVEESTDKRYYEAI
ncbi:UNC93-like protein MFSD11 isoform X1 [Rhopalosiphum padi]|uniref:UNC93-like protein MFSD11 isoform X1 n=1 Tax=Rhopalosiphum padi TaxID=40932 RepID=UPI00298E0E73|nr:UNC93-like protein MFSD11 isoform X1 [Rhopalosiphum padi]XP_060838667.1 UNC93-like protein MFSD11 isoform X1 [Rhopalosiphum padi]XP_060838669.1 UNC93-like protein MFSD11 isoform X1 [Rhopalosiphum padi]